MRAQTKVSQYQFLIQNIKNYWEKEKVDVGRLVKSFQNLKTGFVFFILFVVLLNLSISLDFWLLGGSFVVVLWVFGLSLRQEDWCLLNQERVGLIVLAGGLLICLTILVFPFTLTRLFQSIGVLPIPKLIFAWWTIYTFLKSCGFSKLEKNYHVDLSISRIFNNF